MIKTNLSKSEVVSKFCGVVRGVRSSDFGVAGSDRPLPVNGDLEAVGVYGLAVSKLGLGMAGVGVLLTGVVGVAESLTAAVGELSAAFAAINRDFLST